MAEDTGVLDKPDEPTDGTTNGTTSDGPVGNTESQKSAVETEQTEYEFEIEGEKVKIDRDTFNEVLANTQKAESWEKKHHEKGRKLNQFSQELQVKEKELASDKQLLDEWKAVKTKLDANPESRKLIADALNQAKPSIDPVIKKVQDENADLRKDIDRDRAIQKMSKEFEDFNDEDLAQFQADFNLNDMYDAMKFTYLAKKGSGLDDEIQKARSEMVKGMAKKKGAPPTGKKSVPQTSKPKSWQEMLNAAYERVDNEGTVI